MKKANYVKTENGEFFKVPKNSGIPSYECLTIAHYGEKVIIYGYDLPENQRKEFDFLDDDEFFSSQFIEHKGEFYFFGNFMRTDFMGFDGIFSIGYSSGYLVKFLDDYETVNFAYYY